MGFRLAGVHFLLETSLRTVRPRYKQRHRSTGIAYNKPGLGLSTVAIPTYLGSLHVGRNFELIFYLSISPCYTSFLSRFSVLPAVSTTSRLCSIFGS